MGDSWQEEPEPEHSENSHSSRPRHQLMECHATGVYIDLLQRVFDHETPAETQCSTSGQSTAEEAINSTKQISSNEESVHIATERSYLDLTSPELSPHPGVSAEREFFSGPNQGCAALDPAPPSYTSLPPPIPNIHLPSVISHPPPPSYEDTYGLRYLDRDQPVLVFNAENMWGYRPQLAFCMSCNAMVLTSVTNEFCRITHLTALISFTLCCWPCCVLPYFIPALQEARHQCPACNRLLGTYFPFSRN